MKIIRKTDAVSVSKPEGTHVTYYLFDEYEIHINQQLPHTIQTWHHHKKIWETLCVLEGELTAYWKENEEIKKQIVRAGDIVENEHTPHTFSNDSDKVVKFMVIKQVLTGENKKELFRTDKILD
jgi:uncharacterized cupin superfamily protein